MSEPGVPVETRGGEELCSTCALQIVISGFASETDIRPLRRSLTWGELRKELGCFNLRSVKSGPAWSPTAYRDGAARGNSGVEQVTVAVGDVDDGSDPSRVARRLRDHGLEFLIHSTFSAAPGRPKFRVVVPLARSVPASDWAEIYPRIAAVIADGHADPSTRDPARLYYLPTARPGTEPFTYSGHGRALAESDLPPRVGAPTPRTFTPTGDGHIAHGEHHGYIVSIAASLAARTPGATEEALVAQVRGAVAPTLDDLPTHAREIVDAAHSALAKYGRRTPTAPALPTSAIPIASADPPSSMPDVDDPGPPLWDKAGDPVRAAFVVRLMGRHHFAAFSDSRELLVYEDGVYTRDADALVDGSVESEFRKRDRTASAKFRAEVALAIRARSYFPRSSFNPPGFVNLANGVLHVEQSSFEPHTPDAKFTYKLPTAYDPAATCPVFDEFLTQVLPNEKDREIALEFGGYLLEEGNPYQAALVLVGDGSNGKSTFLSAMVSVLGRDNVAAETLQRLSRGAFSLAELYGKRANICADIPGDRLVATGAFKLLTGGDMLSAERKHRDPFTFVWGGKAIFSCNRLPETDDDSTAFFRRWFILPFNERIEGAKVDTRLPDKLNAERSGILNALLAARRRLNARKGFAAESVGAYREEWSRRSNSLRWFLSERVERDPLKWVAKTAFMATYAAWCGERQLTPKTVAEVGTQIGRWLPGVTSANHRVNGKIVKSWDGLSLADGKADAGDARENGNNSGKADAGDAGDTGGLYYHTPAYSLYSHYDPPTSAASPASAPPDPEDVFHGRPSRADKARASGRWPDPPPDGDVTPPPPGPANAVQAPVDPARLEAVTHDLRDLLRSTGFADRETIHRILGATYTPTEISAAIGAVAASGLVRQEPNGAFSWKEATT